MDCPHRKSISTLKLNYTPSVILKTLSISLKSHIAQQLWHKFRRRLRSVSTALEYTLCFVVRRPTNTVQFGRRSVDSSGDAVRNWRGRLRRIWCRLDSRLRNPADERPHGLNCRWRGLWRRKSFLRRRMIGDRRSHLTRRQTRTRRRRRRRCLRRPRRVRRRRCDAGRWQRYFVGTPLTNVGSLQCRLWRVCEYKSAKVQHGQQLLFKQRLHVQARKCNSWRDKWLYDMIHLSRSL